MTRKHYEAVARAIRDTRDDYAGNSEVDNATAQIARELANTFAADNARFDRERFLTACG